MKTPKEIALIAAAALDSRKGQDIRLLHTTDVTILADYFLICSATSNTQARALADIVEEKLEEAGEKLLHREGHRGGTWELLDYGCLIVHIFTEETRQFYDLERLWRDAIPVDLNTILE